jgi:hypothetical protein
MYERLQKTELRIVPKGKGRAAAKRLLLARPLQRPLDGGHGLRGVEAASPDVERLRRKLLRHAAEIRTLLSQDIPRARKILRRGWSMRPSRTAPATATASRREARAPRCSPRR